MRKIEVTLTFSVNDYGLLHIPDSMIRRQIVDLADEFLGNTDIQVRPHAQIDRNGYATLTITGAKESLHA